MKDFMDLSQLCGEIQRILYIGNTGINVLVGLKLCCSYIERKLIYGCSFFKFIGYDIYY